MCDCSLGNQNSEWETNRLPKLKEGNYAHYVMVKFVTLELKKEKKSISECFVLI